MPIYSAAARTEPFGIKLIYQNFNREQKMPFLYMGNCGKQNILFTETILEKRNGWKSLEVFKKLPLGTLEP